MHVSQFDLTGGTVTTTAVVVIDMLNDFVTGGLKCERAQRIIPNIKKLLQAASSSGNVVVFGNDAHRPEGDREFEPESCVKAVM